MINIVYSLKQVSYCYAKHAPVLTNISAEIYRGEKLVVLGANGSGKSTLLKLLDALIFPTTGEIKAFGEIISEKKFATNPYEFRKKVGFVFQDSDTQLFCSSVFDEVAFAPLQLNFDREKTLDLVNTTLKDFGLSGLKDRPPYRLSGGEKKKVALAAVTAYKPEVLLLDEPTNNLNPKTKKWLVRRLEELNQNGTTIIIATHDLELGKHFANRVLVLNEQHEIAMLAEPEKVFGDNALLEKVNLV